jgi:hypothetical protein
LHNYKWKLPTHSSALFESELKKIAEAAPWSHSFSVSEKLAFYGPGLSGAEHLTIAYWQQTRIGFHESTT